MLNNIAPLKKLSNDDTQVYREREPLGIKGSVQCANELVFTSQKDKKSNSEFQKIGFLDFNTPDFRKIKNAEVDAEMRKTNKIKPQLMFSKLPPVFELPKLTAEKKNPSKNHFEDKTPKYSRNNLEPIKTMILKGKIKILPKRNNPNEPMIVENPMEQSERKINRARPLLKPIEIRDPKKGVKKEENAVDNFNFNFSKNKVFANVDGDEGGGRSSKNISYKSLEKFSKTSEYYYKILENIDPDVYYVEISRLEQHLKLRPGEISKNIKLLNKNQSLLDTTLKEIIREKDKDEMMNAYQMKYEETIPLSCFESGTLKKVLHVPSLKIYTMKEVKIDSSTIQTLSRIIDSWGSLEHAHVKIHSQFHNKPEGHVSYLTEYCPNGSIHYLLNSVGSLPEDILRNISLQIIKALEYYNVKIGARFKYLLPENVMIDAKMNLKLSPGFNQVIQEANTNKRYKILEQLEDSWIKNGISQTKLNRKLDIFDMGVMLMRINCAMMDQFFTDKIMSYTCPHSGENLYSPSPSPSPSSCCCLYHCIEKSEKNEDKNTLKLIEFISSQVFSEEYISFLCAVTNFKVEKTFSFKKVKSHSWLTTHSKDTIKNKILVTFQEMVKLSKEFNFSSEYTMMNDNSMKRFDKLCDAIQAKLPLCQEYFKYHDITNPSHIMRGEITELSKEMGIDKEVVITRLKPLYSLYFTSMVN